MKIYSYSELRKHRKRDLFHIRVSLALRPKNWYVSVIDGKVYDLKNREERMSIWVANGRYGLRAQVEKREYGGVVAFPLAWWRWQLYAAVKRAVHKGHLNIDER